MCEPRQFLRLTPPTAHSSRHSNRRFCLSTDFASGEIHWTLSPDHARVAQGPVRQRCRQLVLSENTSLPARSSLSGYALTSRNLAKIRFLNTSGPQRLRVLAAQASSVATSLLRAWPFGRPSVSAPSDAGRAFGRTGTGFHLRGRCSLVSSCSTRCTLHLSYPHNYLSAEPHVGQVQGRRL